MKKKSLLVLLTFLALNLWAQDKVSPIGAKAWIISPLPDIKAGETFIIEFGLKKMGISPAGWLSPEEMEPDDEKPEGYTNPTGHFHLLVNFNKNGLIPDVRLNPVKGKNDNYCLENGEIQKEISLTAGSHTLQVILVDFEHYLHKKPVKGEIITIVVE